VVQRIGRVLEDYTRLTGVGHVFRAPADISWSDDTLVQPDVFVVPIEDARTLDWARMKTLLLAVEVLSPSTTRADRFTKRRLYQEVGVPLYWIVDPERHCVEVWTPEATFPAVEWERATWTPASAATPLAIELGGLFRPI
jgi:Uma2 family endonuclease